ncbi:MAG: hypothetical protein ACFFE8_05020 [Candidatus Heimdallarchaeota archaeon]
MKYCDSIAPSIENLKQDAKDSEWPNHFSRNAILEQIKHIKSTPDKYLPLVNAYDLTESSQAVGHAKEHEPKIKLLGQSLHSEKESNSWGGMLYRVLGDESTVEDSSKLCIQYIYTYVRQKLPITMYNLVLPLLFLFFISIYFKFDTITYVETSTGGVDPDQFLIVSQYYYGFAVILGSLIFIAGMADLSYTYYRKKVVSVRSLLLVILMVIFGILLIIEFFFFFNPFWTIILAYAINLESTEIDQWIIQIGLVPIILLILIIASVILILYQDTILKNKLTGIWNFIIRKLSHDMDYAPIFVYLEKTTKNKWQVSMIRSDNLHYCITEKKGKSARKYERKGRPTFIMRGLHHSVEPIRGYQIRLYYLKMIFSFVLLLILVFMFVFLTVLDIDIFSLIQSRIRPLIPNFFGLDPVGLDRFSYAIAMLVYRLVYSVAVFGCLYYFITRRPFELRLDEDQNLSEIRYYHLNSVKLQTLWNLKTEAQFLIQEKLQNPFSENMTEEVLRKGKIKQKRYWDSFYDSELEKGDICS